MTFARYYTVAYDSEQHFVPAAFADIPREEETNQFNKTRNLCKAKLAKMRFKTSNLREPKHTDLVSCVSWLSPDDVVSAGDDRRLNKWNLGRNQMLLLRPINQKVDLANL